MDIGDLERKLGIDGLSADEQMALLDALEKSAQSRLETANQESIGKSTEVVIQGLKKIKSDLEAKFAELNGNIEAKVLSIKDGKDGKNGRDGKDGRIGKDGAQGLQGQKGVEGHDGVDGQDGVSVVDAKIDFDGSLVITLSTGKEINVGEVVSPDIAEKIKVISTMSTNGAVAIKDEGTSITSGVKTINFVGATVTATNSGDDVTVNVSAGTGTVTSVAATAGTGISITGSPITTSGTLNITNTQPDQTVSLTASTGISTSGTYPNFTITNSGVTSAVAGTGISVSGATGAVTISNTGVTSVTGTSPVVSSGGATPAVSLATAYGDTLNPYASKTANFVLAAPNGVAGVPTFRAVVAADIPTLNQNTTGTASNVTGTVAVANGGTGGTTTATARTNLGLVIGTDVLAPTGSAASLTSFPTLNQNTTGTAASTPKLLTTNFTIEESGGKLLFKYGATTIASMSSTGVITSATNIIANGTP